MRRKWFRRKTPVQCRFSSTLMSLKTCGLRKLSGFFEYLTFRGPSCLVRLFIDHIENAVKIYISSDAISEIFFWQRSICIRLLVTWTIKMGMKIFKTSRDRFWTSSRNNSCVPLLKNEKKKSPLTPSGLTNKFVPGRQEEKICCVLL